MLSTRSCLPSSRQKSRSALIGLAFSFSQAGRLRLKTLHRVSRRPGQGNRPFAGNGPHAGSSDGHFAGEWPGSRAQAHDAHAARTLLPRPQVQVKVYDELGRFLGRPDLYYASHRLGIEYDGGTHRDRLVDDNRRQNRLTNAGIRLLRYTAADLLSRPDQIVGQVRCALGLPPA
ncbi:MAG: DUF559 domain-containing protein [Chloroflexi bacterium]|nr:MAG: DUF559 domain-containing protein [Chloroflexota bacterium]